LIAFSETIRRRRHYYPLKIFSCLSSCQYKLRQVASQSFSEDNETYNRLSVELWLDREFSVSKLKNTDKTVVSKSTSLFFCCGMNFFCRSIVGFQKVKQSFHRILTEFCLLSTKSHLMTQKKKTVFALRAIRIENHCLPPPSESWLFKKRKKTTISRLTPKNVNPWLTEILLLHPILSQDIVQ